MNDAAAIAVRAVAGGAFVVVFALIAERSRPKSFSGLFSAAPSVALAGLAVAVVAKGGDDARHAAVGMVVGSVAMVVYCVLTAVEIPRLSAAASGLATWAVWLVVAVGLGRLVL